MRRVTELLIAMALVAAASFIAEDAKAVEIRPRLAVLTDIGGDPDDTQSLVRLMVYGNEFQIEALIASASGTRGELGRDVTRPDLIREVIDAYAEVVPNLRLHAEGWPDPESLRAVVVSGNHQRGRDAIGAGHDTDGSRRLIRLIDSGSPGNPLNIAIWGGQTDLAQALWRTKHERGGPGLAEFVKRFRVYDIADQDGIAEWMFETFPGMHYVLSKAPPGADKREATFRGMYLSGDSSLTSRAWVEENVRSCGPLGELYPVKTWTAPNPHGCLKEGDTPSWFFFVPRAGNAPNDPTQPGWGGRFRKTKSGIFRDILPNGKSSAQSTVSRWRADFQADFARRMSWCIAQP